MGSVGRRCLQRLTQCTASGFVAMHDVGAKNLHEYDFKEEVLEWEVGETEQSKERCTEIECKEPIEFYQRERLVVELLTHLCGNVLCGAVLLAEESHQFLELRCSFFL